MPTPNPLFDHLPPIPHLSWDGCTHLNAATMHLTSLPDEMKVTIGKLHRHLLNGLGTGDVTTCTN